MAARDLIFDPNLCFVIGDKYSDIELGKRVGAITILVTGNTVCILNAENGTTPTFSVVGLTEAAQIIADLL